MTSCLVVEAGQIITGDGEGKPLMAVARVRLSIRAALSTKFDGKTAVCDGQFSNELTGVGTAFGGTNLKGACLTHSGSPASLLAIRAGTVQRN